MKANTGAFIINNESKGNLYQPYLCPKKISEVIDFMFGVANILVTIVINVRHWNETIEIDPIVREILNRKCTKLHFSVWNRNACLRDAEKIVQVSLDDNKLDEKTC